jgi:hypothetical protein
LPFSEVHVIFIVLPAVTMSSGPPFIVGLSGGTENRQKSKGQKLDENMTFEKADIIYSTRCNANRIIRKGCPPL